MKNLRDSADLHPWITFEATRRAMIDEAHYLCAVNAHLPPSVMAHRLQDMTDLGQNDRLRIAWKVIALWTPEQRQMLIEQCEGAQ